MAKSDYLENKLIDHLYRGTAMGAQAAGVYVALFTAAPTDAGGGTEVAGGGYARVLVGPSNTAWNATQGGTTGASSGTGGATTNAADITFGTPTANWGSVVAFATFDAVTGGNMLHHGAISPAKTVNNGDPAPVILAGQLSITEG